jgi:hypothetical protein
MIFDGPALRSAAGPLSISESNQSLRVISFEVDSGSCGVDSGPFCQLPVRGKRER